MTEINLKKSTVSLIDSNKIHIHFKENADIGLLDAIIIIEAMGKLSNGKKFPVLIDGGEYVRFDKEVLMFSGCKENNFYATNTTETFAPNTFAQKIIVDFYVNNNSPAVPAYVYNNNEDAMLWLNSFQRY